MSVQSDFDAYTDTEVLAALDEERNKYDKCDALRFDCLVVELQRRGVYPLETVEGNTNTVNQMVKHYGTYWFMWSGGALECPHCQSDLRDHKAGPPFGRAIGVVNNDYVTAYRCPDCGKEFPRGFPESS